MSKVIHVVWILIAFVICGAFAQRMFADPKLLQKVCGKKVDTSAVMAMAAPCVTDVPAEVQSIFGKCMSGGPKDMLSALCQTDQRNKIIKCFQTELGNIKDKKKLSQIQKSGQSFMKCFQKSKSG